MDLSHRIDTEVDHRPPDANPANEGFSVLRSIKLGTFHIGSSLTDLLTSALVNRILIVEFAAPAWPISLLAAFRYFLSPLTLWAGHQSDTRPIRGSRRIAYIWLGRLLMLISLPLLPVSLIALGFDLLSLVGWGLLTFSSVLYGIGGLISGAPFLALVHDTAPYKRRGQVIAIVQTFLVASFAFLGFLYGRLLPEWDPQAFTRLVLFATVAAAFFWIVSVWGEERLHPQQVPDSPEPISFIAITREVLSDRRALAYAIFLGTSAFFAFMQDNVLEPFGGDVFRLSIGETTRFNAYWGTGVLLAMLTTAYLTRRRSPERQISTTTLGLIILALALFALGLAAVWESQMIIIPVLFIFGVGFGIFTIGGVSLLMAMSRDDKAGIYLALWSAIQLLSRGLGISFGGITRDVLLYLTGEFSTAYGILFLIEAIGLFCCIPLLLRVDIKGFAADRYRPPEASELYANAIE